MPKVCPKYAPHGPKHILGGSAGPGPPDRRAAGPHVVAPRISSLSATPGTPLCRAFSRSIDTRTLPLGLGPRKAGIDS